MYFRAPSSTVPPLFDPNTEGSMDLINKIITIDGGDPLLLCFEAKAGLDGYARCYTMDPTSSRNGGQFIQMLMNPDGTPLVVCRYGAVLVTDHVIKLTTGYTPDVTQGSFPIESTASGLNGASA